MIDTPSSVIDDLGGTGAVAAALSLADNTVSSWRERGIPPARWPSLVRLADEQGRKEITFEALAAIPAPETAEARPA